MTQFARAEGAAEIVGLEPNPVRAANAQRLGLVDSLIDPQAWSADDYRKSGRDRFAIAVECAGSPVSLDYLVQTTGDVVALFGTQETDYLLPARGGPLKLFAYPGYSIEAARYALRHVSRAKVRLKYLVDRFMSLSDYAEAVELLLDSD